MLEPAGWFEREHDNDGGEINVDIVWIPRFKAGTFVWSSTPAVDRIMIEELSKASKKKIQLEHEMEDIKDKRRNHAQSTDAGIVNKI